jgi:hypothetical protein
VGTLIMTLMQQLISNLGVNQYPSIHMPKWVSFGI